MPADVLLRIIGGFIEGWFEGYRKNELIEDY